MSKKLLPAIAVLVASAALAGTTDDGISDAIYLEYARGFAQYTARLTVVDPAGVKSEASAVIIADHWALTAAHVVEDVATADVNGNPVRLVCANRDHKEKQFGIGDIAMLRCERPFGLDYYPKLSDGAEEPGDVVSIAGYGAHGRMSVGHTHYDQRLRAGTNTIERFERGLIVCRGRRRSSPMEYIIAPGDSGGPLFARGRLAGVNSVTMRDKPPLRSVEGEESGHTRVSLYADWIRSVMEADQ